jgi:spore coat protein CotH
MSAKLSIHSRSLLAVVATLVPLLFSVTATFAIAAELKLGPSPSDALFDPSRVIQIEIRLDPKDWLARRISHPILDETGDISVTEKGYKYYRGEVVIDGHIVKSVGVRKKGAVGSMNSARPSLTIKLDEYVKDQGFSGLDMLTLNHCLQDPTKAREFLAYSFMQRAGVPAPRGNLARVTVNGEDLGIYAFLPKGRWRSL